MATATVRMSHTCPSCEREVIGSDKCPVCSPGRVHRAKSLPICRDCPHYVTCKDGRVGCDLHSVSPCRIHNHLLAGGACLDTAKPKFEAAFKKPQPVNLSQFTSNRFDRANEVALVTFHYNPSRFRRLRETYYEWLPTLGPLAKQLRCYELVLDDDRPEIGGSIVIQGTRAKNTLWQKEAIVNVALRDSPPHIKYFAWLDHDIISSNANWLSDAVAKIDAGAVAVQLFSSLIRLSLDKNEILRKPSSLIDGSGCPGGLWIADREYLDRIGGLNIDNIFGGGDQTFLDAMNGKPGRHLNEYSEPLKERLRQWIAFASDARGGRKADYITSDGYHLWHGDHKDRQYGTRNKILIDNDFDPATDMRIGENGLLEWASDKPELHAGVARFFANRKEDG